MVTQNTGSNKLKFVAFILSTFVKRPVYVTYYSTDNGHCTSAICELEVLYSAIYIWKKKSDSNYSYKFGFDHISQLICTLNSPPPFNSISYPNSTVLVGWESS